MQSDPTFVPRLCKDCKFHRPEPKSLWNNLCTHARVVAVFPFALAGNREGEPAYPQCHEERSKRGWWAPCGMRGKLWSPR